MPLYVIPKRFQLRGDTAAVLAARNEVLMEREFCQETDTERFKLGDGTTRWLDLPYAGHGSADLTDLADGSILVYNATSGQWEATEMQGVSFAYATDTGSTADSDPGAGLMKWNNATQSSATFLYFDDATADTGTDLSAFFSELSASSSTGFVQMRDSGGNFQIYKWTGITDGTGYFKFAVSHVVSSGTFADEANIRVAFHPLGSGGGGGSSTWTTVKKTATTNRASTTTLADDPHLTFSCSAGTTYGIRAKLFFEVANATMDVKIMPNYTGTTNAVINRRVLHVGSNTPVQNITNSLTTTIPDATAASLIYVEYDITLDCNTAGTFAFQWAQNTSNASNLTLHKTSRLEYTTF